MVSYYAAIVYIAYTNTAILTMGKAGAAVVVADAHAIAFDAGSIDADGMVAISGFSHFSVYAVNSFWSDGEGDVAIVRTTTGIGG